MLVLQWIDPTLHSAPTEASSVSSTRTISKRFAIKSTAARCALAEGNARIDRVRAEKVTISERVDRALRSNGTPGMGVNLWGEVP